MKGYLAISSENWCDQIKASGTERAVFWRKRTTFKTISKGDYFYFLSRKRADGKRYVLGRSVFIGTKAMTPNDAWTTYGALLGSEKKQDFLSAITKFYSGEVNLGCIELSDVVFADNPVELSECGIPFSDGTVSGKTIDEKECMAINERLELVSKNETRIYG